MKVRFSRRVADGRQELDRMHWPNPPLSFAPRLGRLQLPRKRLMLFRPINKGSSGLLHSPGVVRRRNDTHAT